MQSKYKSNSARNTTVTAYEGGNEIMNRLMEDDEVVWICNGPGGRRPVLGGTEEEAKQYYLDKWCLRVEEDEDD